MKARPIIFDKHSVKTTFEGCKTKTRRVAKGAYAPLPEFVKNPYGVAGDILWVKESFWTRANEVSYEPQHEQGWEKRNVLFMPRRHSRLTLRITGYWLEYLQDITDEDILAEGITISEGNLRDVWIQRWDSINAKRGYPWAENPVVHVVSFKILDTFDKVGGLKNA